MMNFRNTTVSEICVQTRRIFRKEELIDEGFRNLRLHQKVAQA